MSIPDKPTKPSDFQYSTIKKLVEQKSKEHKNKTLIVEDKTKRELTFQEADEKSDEVAAALQEMNIRKGDVVATLMENSIDHALVLLGCLKQGIIFSALNAEFKHDDLLRAIKDVEPELLIFDSTFWENYNSIQEKVNIQRELVRGDELDGMYKFSKLFQSSESLSDIKVSPDDPGVILFTGGTTGVPKPVLNPQFGSVAGAYRFQDSYDPKSEDIFMTFGQLFHVAGQQHGVLGPMLSGITCILPNQFSASEYWNRVNEYEATIIDAGGDIQDAILAAHPEPVENTAKKSLAVGSSDTNLRFKEQFGIDNMVEGWAMTEVGGVNLIYQDFQPGDENGKPIGKGGKWAEVAIMDSEGGQLPPGPEHIGEIHVRPKVSHTFMKRYYGYPDQTISSWQNLWLGTGDMGYKDENGVVYFSGRAVDHLRRFGENFSAQEVESTLNKHTAVAASGVIGVPNETISGDDAKAYIVITDDEEADPRELFNWCNERLADFKVPRYIEFVDNLPRGEAKQQIKRNELAERGIGEAWDKEKHK